MGDVDLLYNFPQPNSPTLFLEEPISHADDHLLRDLLDHQPILRDTTGNSVTTNSQSLFTDSTVVSTTPSIAIPSTSSIDKCSFING